MAQEFLGREMVDAVLGSLGLGYFNGTLTLHGGRADFAQECSSECCDFSLSHPNRHGSVCCMPIP